MIDGWGGNGVGGTEGSRRHGVGLEGEAVGARTSPQYSPHELRTIQ